MSASEAAVVSSSHARPSARRSVAKKVTKAVSRSRTRTGSRTSSRTGSRTSRKHKSARTAKHAFSSRRGKTVARSAPRAIPPQQYVDKLNKLTVKPGLVHRFYKGPLNINVVEVDMNNPDLVVRPYLAGHNFDTLKTVRGHAQDSGALVSVNANYFKTDGTPLGAIKMDGQWVSGSLFNRVAMGITPERQVKFARVTLHGDMKTSNPAVETIWVNNMNSPRRSGTRLILYTRKWGDSVTLPYQGNLVGVSAQGEVSDVSDRAMKIPYGGYVLTDRKESQIANLKRGDFVNLRWKTRPKDWNDVEHAVSGGPTLIKDGKLFVGLKDEHFNLAWTSSKITRRTACGITKDNKMILATVEGSHNMWDLAKFMQQLGCVDAMNLDGGGSTTMVVNGTTVTRNTGEQRKVAASICVMDANVAARHVRAPGRRYQPACDLVTFSNFLSPLSAFKSMSGMNFVHTQRAQLDLLTLADPYSRPEDFVKAMQSPVEMPPTGVICESSGIDPVIDIDNDMVDSCDIAPSNLKTRSAEKQEKKASAEKKKKELKKAMKKLPSPIEDGPSGWTKKILKPFSLGRSKG
ncbi:MAG: phosphodiester glycosidase family protein [Candidatus Obscuribacterales bacterium]|nr:phosphodiester glycosidase family protein [Candidatus Obscuribacterales bacterium]